MTIEVTGLCVPNYTTDERVGITSATGSISIIQLLKKYKYMVAQLGMTYEYRY